MAEVIHATVIGASNANTSNINIEPEEEYFDDGLVDEEAGTTDDLINTFKEAFDKVASAIPTNVEGDAKKDNVFKRFANYIGSKQFKNDLDEKAEKYNVPKKELAKTFFGKVLALLGDTLGIIVNTACSIADTLATIISTLLHSAVSVVAKAGNALSSLISGNRTNLATV